MKWTVGSKIGMGFGLALLILVAIGGVAYQSMSRLVETSTWVTHTHKVLENLGGLLQSLTDAETGQRGYLLSSQDPYLEPYEASVSMTNQHLLAVRELTRDNVNQQRRMDLLEPLIQKRMASLKEGIEVGKSKGFEAGREWVLTGKGKVEMDEARKLIAEMSGEEKKLLDFRAEEAAVTAQTTKLTILGGAVTAFVLLSVVGIAITRNISRPLQQITATAERIATGDLSGIVVADHRRDEIGVLARTFSRMTQSLQAMADLAAKIAAGDLKVKVTPQSDKDLLGNAFASMVENLQRLTGQMAEGINILSTSASQISTSTSQLAGSAAETATAVSQATTTVEEVRQTAQLSSQKSKMVSDGAQRMSQTSLDGMRSTDETVEGINRIREQMDSISDTMARLSEQSQAIGQIVSTVEDLAGQSNLLAVNASIEAAKAGEHGKGFAVVAQEVRSLAEQSKQATNQVRNILNDIQKATGAAAMATEQGSKAVEAGAKQAGQAGQSIQSLSNSVAEGAQAATQIAASSQQQLVGVDQVASAMESIKQASTQNVASAQQLEAAAHNLKGLGQKLKLMIEHYKV